MVVLHVFGGKQYVVSHCAVASARQYCAVHIVLPFSSGVVAPLFYDSSVSPTPPVSVFSLGNAQGCIEAWFLRPSQRLKRPFIFPTRRGEFALFVALGLTGMMGGQLVRTRQCCSG